MNTERIELTDELHAKLKAVELLDVDETMCVDSNIFRYLAQPFRVFQLNECDWWMARSISEAKRDYLEMTGVEVEQVEDAIELTDEQMESEPYKTEDGPVITFAEELRRMIEHAPVSSLFASTEY